MLKKTVGATHSATAAAAKTTAFISELAVPGMSGATNHSVGPSPVGPELGGGASSDPQSAPTPENIIKPDVDSIDNPRSK